MKLDEYPKYHDVKSQWKNHNTVVKGFNDGLEETFERNIHKEYPPQDKWETLKNLIDADMSHSVHYSNDKQFEHNQLLRVKEHMRYLEEKEKNQEKGFLFTDVPEFDKPTWEKMLKNLQGLS